MATDAEDCTPATKINALGTAAAHHDRCASLLGQGCDCPRRRYDEAEEAAFRAAGMNPMYGPAQFAGGPYWPDELDKRADRLEALVPHLRLAAAALRREIAADPLTAAGVSDA